ncbi:MAG: PmoA family protein, partial [Planctomycetes bacterium]|nr:PmoA family protein [Planctomycetota bacterium]
RARALDYHGLIGGKPVGVAICDHPDNLKHPSPWYVIRDDPMSYFSPAVLCYGPHTLPAGQSFTLRYRVIIHEGRWDSKRLEREYNEFVKSTRAAGGREKSTSTKTKE